MKRIMRILTIAVTVIALLMGTSCNQTPQNQTNTNNNSQMGRRVTLTSENFDEYFDISYTVSNSSFSKALSHTGKGFSGTEYFWNITGYCNLVILIVPKRMLNVDNCSVNVSISLDGPYGMDYWLFSNDKTKDSVTMYLSSSQSTKTISLYGWQTIGTIDKNYEAQIWLPGSSSSTPCDISVVSCSGSIYVNN